MTIHQTRHFQPEEDSLVSSYRRNSNVLQAVLGNIEYAPGVSSLNNTALDSAIKGILLNKTNDEISGNFKLLAEMGVFTFQMNQAKSGTFISSVWGKEYEFTGNREGSYITATDWVLYLQCATIANDIKSIDYLLSLTSEVFELTSASFDAFDRALVECYKAIYLDFENEEKIIKLISSAEEKSNHPFFNNYVVPVLSVYQSFYSKQEGLIDETIVKALTKHVNYWEKEDNKYAVKGWISIPLISALIHKNYHTEVKSAYLPENIIP